MTHPPIHKALVKAAMALCVTAVCTAASASDITVKQVQFKRGESSASLAGTIKGRAGTDYQLKAAAGQTLSIKAAAGKSTASFNVLPPGSGDVAMFIDGRPGNDFSGVLPEDGTYTIRLYQSRAEGRRGEIASYALTVTVTGAPMPATSAKRDAVVAKTRYHATTTAPCKPAYSEVKECQLGVIRRGTDGSATVVANWKTEGGTNGVRRILFVKGKPVASDSTAPLTFTKDERGWKVKWDNEQFDVPEPLVMGG